MTSNDKHKLLMDNINLVHSLLQKNNITPSMPIYDDLFQECCATLLKKLDGFNPNRGKLSTFFYCVIKTTVAMYYRKQNKTPVTVSENLTVNSCKDIKLYESSLFVDDSQDLIKRFNDKEIMDWLLSLDIKNLDMFLEFHFENKSIREIAESRGIAYTSKNQINISKKLGRCRDNIRKLYIERFK